MLDDPGVGWHLRNIDAMIEQGSWLTNDPFTANRETAVWHTNQWLGDFALWTGWKWGGLEGIAAVATIFLALTLRHLFRILSADGVPWPLALLWTHLAALGISFAFVARPNVFTIFAVMVTASKLDRFHRGTCSRHATLWLLPLFLVWVNTHGGFLAGLMMLVGAILIEGALALGIPHGKDRSNARSRMVHLIKLTTAGFVCTLANPYGWNIYPWILQLLGNPFFMEFNGEWHSFDFHALGAHRLELLILLLPICLALSKRSPSLMALGLCLLWLHLGLGCKRYMPLWVVVAVPLLARLSAEIPWLTSLGKNLQITPELRQALGKPATHASPLFAMICCLALLTWSKFYDDYSYHDPKHIPAAALDHVLEQHADKRIFNHHDWGGYLTWHGWPRVKNWLDDRAEVQGQPHLETYLELISADGDWQQTFDEQGIEVVCIAPDSMLSRELSSHPAWRETFRDEHAVVFLNDADQYSVKLFDEHNGNPTQKAL